MPDKSCLLAYFLGDIKSETVVWNFVSWNCPRCFSSGRKSWEFWHAETATMWWFIQPIHNMTREPSHGYRQCQRNWIFIFHPGNLLEFHHVHNSLLSWTSYESDLIMSAAVVTTTTTKFFAMYASSCFELRREPTGDGSILIHSSSSARPISMQKGWSDTIMIRRAAEQRQSDG